jgi:hypothetical protein
LDLALVFIAMLTNIPFNSPVSFLTAQPIRLGKKSGFAKQFQPVLLQLLQ